MTNYGYYYFGKKENHMMIKNRILKHISFLLCASVVAGGLSACNVYYKPEPRHQLLVEVFYLQRIALPAQAKVSVTLNDVSLADAPAVVIDRQEITANGKQVPIIFTLTYDPTQLIAGHTYSVGARIELDGQLMFINTEHHGVKLDGSDIQPVRVRVNTPH